MTVTSELYYDPYDAGIFADPYPVYRRLRDEAPLYHNDRYDFYVLSRHSDVEGALVDHQGLISSRGDILDQIKTNFQFPPGSLIFEDPPVHTARRALLSRVFTPKKMTTLEPQIREYCARCLDPLIDRGGFDFVKDIGNKLPMRVIGMLMGIPEQDQDHIKQWADETLRSEPGKQWDIPEGYVDGAIFADYVEWRADHPSDDLMTELLQAEFEDETGTIRRLSRQEVLTYVNIVTVAGNEITGRLIGWAGKLLAEFPDQRRQLVQDASLIPNAIEEMLRYEPTGHAAARYVTRDTAYYGQDVPEGSAMLILMASANRDDRRFPDPDRFDIHREIKQHLTFGYGIHFCLGAALARLEGRIALEEILRRFPEWQVDLEAAKLATTTSVRGWDTLPVSSS